jgi:hypothetical protein
LLRIQNEVQRDHEKIYLDAGRRRDLLQEWSFWTTVTVSAFFFKEDFVSTTHLPMAHFERTPEATQQVYRGVLGTRVELKVTALLWSTLFAAFVVDVAEQTECGKKLSKSHNPFSHITIWFRGTTAFMANWLPDLVKSGEAQRIEFENPNHCRTHEPSFQGTQANKSNRYFSSPAVST